MTQKIPCGKMLSENVRAKKLVKKCEFKRLINADFVFTDLREAVGGKRE